MPNPIYVPILKGKEGEFAALDALSSDVKSCVVPLIEIPNIPYDFALERPAKTLDEHIASVPERLKRSCGANPLYLDLPWFDTDEIIADGRTALEAIFQRCSHIGVHVIPVVARAHSTRYVHAAAKCFQSSKAMAIRLLVEDFEEDLDVEEEVTNLLSALGGLNPEDVDLIVDLENLSADLGRATLIARSVLSMVPFVSRWKRLVLAAASFPEDLSDVGASSTSNLPRLEWDLWKALQRRKKSLPRADMIFGDYAMAHPFPKELDPRTMRMSANIRYTTFDDWLILKGRNVRQYGFEQYFELCEQLIKRPEYVGANYSWGDGYIFECAQGVVGPGNATTWRKVGVNHHITLVARSISSFPDS